MNKKLGINLLLTLVLLGAALLRPASAEELTWTGCGITKLAFMEEVAKAYEAKTGIATKITGGGATKGIRAAAAGTSDMGGTCRHWLRSADGQINPEEKNAKLVQVAWDALVAIAHPSNPVENVSVAQLKQIYDGEITNWSQVGGPDKPIALITREGKYSGVGHMFRMMVFGDQEYEFKARSLKVKSTGPLEKDVEKIAGALGMDGISSARKREVKFLSLDGVAPTKENIASGKYPLFRPLYLAISADKARPETQAFIDFILSPEGQQIISNQGTVNLEEGKALNAPWDGKKEKYGL